MSRWLLTSLFLCSIACAVDEPVPIDEGIGTESYDSDDGASSESGQHLDGSGVVDIDIDGVPVDTPYGPCTDDGPSECRKPTPECFETLGQCGAVCSEPRHCPMAQSGNAVPDCVVFGRPHSGWWENGCVLSCDSEHQCPNGMICEFSEYCLDCESAICVWPG